jgi:hypothetical protein
LTTYAAPLLNIAIQCAISGGPAVYWARSLYFIIDPEMTYDDDLSCLQSGYIFRTSRNVMQNSKLFPNPAQDLLNLIYSISEPSIFTVTDEIGKTLLSKKISPDQFETEVDVSKLANGLYFYDITNSNGKVDVGQFVISK